MGRDFKARLATRRAVVVSGIAGLTSVGVPAAAAAAAAPLVDLMPAFWRAWNATRELPADAVPAALIARFFQPHADVYAGAGIKVNENRVGKWIRQVSPLIPPIRRLSMDFRTSFDLHVRHFARTFPDFDARATAVYLMPSLAHFDGHLQQWGDRIPLFVGADGIVLYHGRNPNLAVLLDHETFHLYHFQKNPSLRSPGPDPVYLTLWLEGLATYVSGELNPQASRLNVLLDDKPLAAAGDDLVRRVAAELLQRLASTSGSDQKRYFSAGYVGDLPARSGYLVGLQVARRAARGRTLPGMARIDRVALKPLIEAELKQIAQGGGAG